MSNKGFKPNNKNFKIIQNDAFSVILFTLLTSSSALFYFGLSGLLVFFGTAVETGIAGTISRSIQMAVAFFSLGLATLVNFSAMDEENIVSRVFWSRLILFPFLIITFIFIQFWLNIPHFWLLSFFVMGSSLLQTQIYLDASKNKVKTSFAYALSFYGLFFLLFVFSQLNVFMIPLIGLVTGIFGTIFFLLLHREMIVKITFLTKYHIKQAFFFYMDGITFNLLLLDQLIVVSFLGQEVGGVYEWNSVVSRSILLLSAALYTLAMRKFLAIRPLPEKALKYLFYVLGLSFLFTFAVVSVVTVAYYLLFNLGFVSIIFRDYMLLLPLMIASIFWNLNGVLSAFLFSKNNFYLSPLTNTIGVIVLIVTNITLIPIYGVLVSSITFASVASIVFIARLIFCLKYIIKKKENHKPF